MLPRPPPPLLEGVEVAAVPPLELPEELPELEEPPEPEDPPELDEPPELEDPPDVLPALKVTCICGEVYVKTVGSVPFCGGTAGQESV